jgi:hypothetical protein
MPLSHKGRLKTKESQANSLNRDLNGTNHVIETFEYYVPHIINIK